MGRSAGHRGGRHRLALFGCVAVIAIVAVAGAVAAVRSRGDRADRAPPASGRAAASASAEAGRSWAPAARRVSGLQVPATAGDGLFALHTAGGDVTFLPGVNLGSTTPGHQPGELSIDSGQYRRWFGEMAALGIRAVRIYTIHPPAFYQELAEYNRTHSSRPLYLMQGVYLPDESYVRTHDLYGDGVTNAFRDELRDAADAAAGRLDRAPRPGHASGSWDADVNPWIAGWIIGVEFDPAAVAGSDRGNAGAPDVKGRYFRSSPDATATERWLAARMDELAGYQAGRGYSQPIAFVNWPTTDPLRHPEEPSSTEDLLQLDANHVRPTAAWPAGTFASYHAYPYYPDFQRHEPGLQRGDPYARYLAELKKHHGDMPTMITEFGVPSSIGSAHSAPLGRSQGGHTEAEATRIDAGLLHVIKDQGLAGAFLFAWMDEWFKYTWNTVRHQVPERRQLWHDPLTNEQHFGLLAMDAAGPPDAVPTALLDGRVEARTDESSLSLTVHRPPATMTLGFDVLPGITGSPPPGSGSRTADAAFVLNPAARTGQAYLRAQLDPVPLDDPKSEARRGPAPNGWRRVELLLNHARVVPGTGRRLPAEIQNAGDLRYGELWRHDGESLTIRVPWAMLGFADPSAHRVGIPDGTTLTTQVSPGIGVTLSAAGTDHQAGTVGWTDWNRPYYNERLKTGTEAVRQAYLAVAQPG
ncbi:hypothetical protein [Actinoplanes sp. NPDC049118]|uniref:hypothetical protein n=1 Tax=Actinoplanes sp. NPDC049118 TaxID=3155769 RepID=UPI0033D4F174